MYLVCVVESRVEIYGVGDVESNFRRVFDGYLFGGVVGERDFD